MPESHTDNKLATWTVEQCSFTVEYSLRVMDDIRLAVVDAFFSLPRGGAEIGGILLGRHSGRRVTITGYAPLDCEHATGPSFVLSLNDHGRLADLLASSRGNLTGTQPVGWYHSHTRSEIFLSEADIEIHKRYFPEPWQVALVLKPHTFHPARAGFFFREGDGSIHSTESYREFVLDPLGSRTSVDPPQVALAPVAPSRPRPEPPRPVIPVFQPQPEAPPPVPRMDAAVPVTPRFVPPPEPEPPRAESVPETPPETVQVTPPTFIQSEPTRSWGGLGILIALSVGLLFGAGAYQTRNLWLPRSLTSGEASPTAAHPHLGLNTIDNDGQLQIRWDPDSPTVRNAVEANLIIEDGPVPQAILLDPAHLRTGSFTYGRQTERVDVALTVHGPANQSVKEVSTYLGKLPVRAPADSTKELRGRTKKLEKTVEDLRKEIRQRKRLGNQSPDSVK